MNRFSALAWIALLGLTTGATASANVLIVAPSGGDYTNIQVAINAAIDCDVILVKSGTYAGFVINNRDLEIVEDYAQTATIVGGVRLLNLSAGRDVLIDGFDIEALPSAPQAYLHGFSAVDCAGSIRIQDCSFRPGDSAHSGAHFRDCTDVVIMDSTLAGRGGDVDSSRGFECVGSNVAVYRTVASGGATNHLGYGANGGDGAQLQASYLFAAGSSIVGGDGEYGWLTCFPVQYCDDGGDGGDGLVGRTGSMIELVETPTSGGAGGDAGCCAQVCCVDGTPGTPIVLMDGSTSADLPHHARGMSVNGPLREKTRATIEFRGQPGDVLRLALSEATHFAFDPASIGVQIFAAGPLTRARTLGPIDASGVLTFALDLPDLGPGVASRTQYMQAIFRDVNGQQHLGSPRAVVVLDSAY
jgi:hypothetical protein